MKTNCMNIAWIAAAAALLPMGLGAQVDPNSANPNPQPALNMPQPGPSNGPQPTTMRDSLGAPGLTGQEMLDDQFMRSFAEGGVADIKLGMLAVEKGSPAVKELGQKIVDDHTAINKDMADVADQLGVMLPKKMSKGDQAEYKKLSGLSGKDFDTEYLTYTAKMHYQDLHNFRMEASVAADADLQAEVVKAMIVMRQHVTLITKAATDEGIALPPRPQRPAATTAAK